VSPVSRGRKRKPVKASQKKRARRQVQDTPHRPRSFDPTVYVDDLSPLVSKAEVERTVDRRLFVMPFFGTTIDGEDFDQLNPADPDERALLIKGEHPELHEALAEPDFDTDAAGFSPRFHLTMHEVIANQLWDNDPPEVWQAAQRLRDQGLERHDILHELLEVMVTHMHPVLAKQEPFNSDAYRRDLNDLGRPEAPRTRPSLATYQIKVSIDGSDPAIWRRFSLPGDTPLDVLHRVIQVAFGWESCHVHQFEARGKRYTDTSFGASGGALDERRSTLAAVAPRVGSRLRYTYDFGDDWVHDIAVEVVDPAEPEPRVVCLSGERAGPPEDSGGIFAYLDMLEALGDPEHPDHDDHLEWVGEDFDPEAVDLNAINDALAAVSVPGGR
jgi:Plasmid pRiA4b ORF-3-like protein/Domain of unknown function (DUF1841)